MFDADSRLAECAVRYLGKSPQRSHLGFDAKHAMRRVTVNL